jgi:hypothetical protein
MAHQGSGSNDTPNRPAPMSMNVGVGQTLDICMGGVDDSDRSVGGTAYLSTLGLLEFLYYSCLVAPKFFCGATPTFWLSGLGDKSLAGTQQE